MAVLRKASLSSASTPPSTFGGGVRTATPVILGYVPIGFAFGVLARTIGLSVAEIGLMSLLVYAGSAQFIGVGMFGAGMASPAIISTTFLVNLRHLLMSTALAPSMRDNAAWQNVLLAYGITDETFALNSSLLRGRPASPVYMAGVHIAAQSAWVVATIAGGLVSQMAGRAEAFGLDFALPAMFTGLLVPNLGGEDRAARRAAALVAAAVAVSALLLMPGNSWAVIAATLVAATVGAVRR
ncbi:MAG: AzlC family ABC transporter permease [Bacillota bacterium]